MGILMICHEIFFLAGHEGKPELVNNKKRMSYNFTPKEFAVLKGIKIFGDFD